MKTTKKQLKRIIQEEQPISENRKIELQSLVKYIFESTDEQDEGNAFSGARQDAIDNDEDEFEVSGKTYKVKGPYQVVHNQSSYGKVDLRINNN